MQDMSRVLVALPASARSFSLNPPIWPSKPLVWPGQEAISAAEAVHLLGATPCNCQRAPDLRGHRRAHGVSVDSGLPWNHQEPLCGPPFPQLATDRRDQSYRFSFGEVMRSPTRHVLIIIHHEASHFVLGIVAQLAFRTSQAGVL